VFCLSGCWTSRWLVGATFGEQRPDDSRRLVRQGHRHDFKRLACDQTANPVWKLQAPLALLDDRDSPDDQQRPELFVAALRDRAQSLLAAAGMRTWGKA